VTERSPKPHLLESDEPPPFELVTGSPSSAFLLACDHASPRIPRSLGLLGLTASELESHIAWDIGIAQMSRRMAALLESDLILQNYSRLVIDCNRPLDVADSIVQVSANVPVPGNLGLSENAVAQRVRQVFRPYHDCIEQVLKVRARAGQTTIYVAMHSFTPVFLGVARPWHVGVLYQRDARLGHALLASLRSEVDLVVGDNEPYRVTDQSDYSIVTYGEGRGLLHVEIEVRQDLIADAEGQWVWAERLANHLSQAVQSQAHFAAAD
jgi:predicted N-formylglutamate amidohydrolase